MAAKALQVHFGIVMRSSDADCGMAELVQIPVWCVLLPQGICLTVGEAGIAPGREIHSPGPPSPTMRGKERPGGGGPPGEEVIVGQCPPPPGEKNIAPAPPPFTNYNGAVLPAN